MYLGVGVARGTLVCASADVSGGRVLSGDSAAGEAFGFDSSGERNGSRRVALAWYMRRRFAEGRGVEGTAGGGEGVILARDWTGAVS